MRRTQELANATEKTCASRVAARDVFFLHEGRKKYFESCVWAKRALAPSELGRDHHASAAFGLATVSSCENVTPSPFPDCRAGVEAARSTHQADDGAQRRQSTAAKLAGLARPRAA